MRLLVDGYNVLFALGLIPSRPGPKVLEQARAGLLDLLADALGANTRDAVVVFDAAGAPPGVPGDFRKHGIKVRFARKKQEADDLIEELIAECERPRQLVVVSTDRRLVKAAGRTGATSVRSDQFLEWLDAEARRQQAAVERSAEADERDRKPTAEQIAYWLDKFRHLDDDPTLAGPDDLEAAFGDPDE